MRDLTRREFLELAATRSIAASFAANALLSACRSTVDRPSALGLDTDTTSTLIALIDEIIPAAEGMPAASEAGTLAYFELLSAVEPTLRETLQTAVRRADDLSRVQAQKGTVDSRGRVRGALYFDRDGTLQEELARVVVVCCNGVGTPRLLLNSVSSQFPQGLANSSGLVGTHFMVHPARFVQGIFQEALDGHIGPMGNPLYSQEFYETDARRGFVRGYTLVGERTFGPFSHTPDVPWGSEHHRVMRSKFPHTAGVTVLADDLPEARNRIDLDSTRTDSNGIPAARATYSLSENSKKMLDHGAARAAEVLKAAGAIEIIDPGNTNMAHLMGTARMGDNRNRSVVTAWNQAHDVPNLFIVDGSSFTTGAGVNPTSTIGALALRAADNIWQRRREWI